MVAATVRTNLSRCLERCIQTSEPGSGHLDCDLAKRTAECLAKSSTKELHVEALCLEVASALEKHGRWRPAWDLLFGLMQHLGAASRTRAAASMYAHVVMRAASCAGRGGVSAGGDLCEIVELCFHLRSCFLEALSLNDKLGQRNVQARKLLEWLVHVAVPVSSHLLAKKCWQEVQQALQQGGNQAMKALMQGRTAEEQTQLVRLICCHARSVQPDAADLVADVLKALLAGQHRKSAKPNEVAIWLKAVMTTMDVLAHLLRSSWQKSSSMLDWADQFLADFSGTLAGGLESPSLQPLLLLLVRARVRVLEACRRESRELLAITRKEIFQLYGLQLWQSQLQETEGTAPLAPPAPCAPQCLLELLGCGRSWQQLEAVRLQLPAGSVAGALLALRQLQLHVEADDAASLLALGRLVLALSQDPDFRSLAPQALAAARRRLAGLGEGRGRLLAAQLCAVEAQLEASEAHQECERFLSQALSLWYRAAGLDRSSLGFSVNSVARVLRCCTGALVLRELLDAAHLLETLDLHVLTVQVLVLCLACMVQQQGPKGLWWLMPDKSGLPPDDSAQACVVLLYRLAAAEGRLATTDEEAFVALEWWQTAEAARAALRATDAVAVARAVCLGALPEAAILALHQRGCTLEVLMPECTAEMAGLLPHQAMTLAEAFLALAQWSAHWQDVSPGQCPGGSTITAQCAALKSLALLYGAPKPATERPQPTATNGPVAPWARWPAQRSALLQLRVIYQVSLLYERLGEAELAGACAESGLQLMERKLCGAHGWKLRFLCLRARSAITRSVHARNPVKEKPDSEIDNLLAEVEELWNRRMAGRPVVSLMQNLSGADSDDFEAGLRSMPVELLALWAHAPSRASLLEKANVLLHAPSTRHLQLLLQLLDEASLDTPLFAQSFLRLRDLLATFGSRDLVPQPLCRALASVAGTLQRLNSSQRPPEMRLSHLAAEVLARQGPLLSSEELQMLEPEAPAALALTGAAALRGALCSGDSAAARQAAFLLLRAAETEAADATPHSFRTVAETRCTEAESSRSRSPRRSPPSEHGLWKQVVPVCSGVSLLFLSELRSMQRHIEARAAELFEAPHRRAKGRLTVQELCAGAWLDRKADTSMAWLQVDWKSQALQITRSIDSHPGRVISRRVQLAPGLLQCLQEDLQSLHAMNGEKIRELWQRPGKDSEAARLEFWSNRKRFDEQLGRVAERIQQELLGPWRCLLAPLPPGQWLRLREMARTWRQKEVSAEEEFLLALLLLEARQMEVPEIAAVLGDSKLRPASSLKRYSLELGLEEVEAPLLLYVDANMAQLPLEACPCLRNRSVVRGLAPNIMPATVAAATGFFVIDPAEDCTQMGDVKRLLTSWSEGQSWHGHTGLPMPAPAEVLDELCRNDVFVYLGHGERARQLLRQDRVRMPGTAHDGSGDLRSILMLLGCSSVKIRPQSVGAFECFGLPGRALLAGAPLVLGAMWDVLGGDLDKFACRLLQKWWQKPDGSQGGLLSALRLLRPKCLLPNLTGAALVCYGNPM
ncbi:unnamed protein product [Effrenium voratum]|uniref:separase n=1 Tax=Effrenium voratum TaxID=2562239 RepID=A0AA36JHI2_9DINO|nr:unnamed protein product [Effrenium voratum]CAJ1421550.1 unnamed protein product [Effrenium voratum]